MAERVCFKPINLNNGLIQQTEAFEISVGRRQKRRRIRAIQRLPLLPCVRPVRIVCVTGGIVDEFLELRVGDFERTNEIGGEPDVVWLAGTQLIAEQKITAGNKSKLRHIRRQTRWGLRYRWANGDCE